MPKSSTEWIIAAVFGIMMYRLDGWSYAFKAVGSVVRPALATMTPAENANAYSRAIRAAMERRARERRRGY